MDWVAIDSQRSDLGAVPTKACFFNTSTNLISVVGKRVRPRNHSLLPNVSVVSLSQCWGTLDFLLYKQISNISESEELGVSIFQTSRTARFHQRTSGYLTFPNVFVDRGLCIRKTGCFVFSENGD